MVDSRPLSLIATAVALALNDDSMQQNILEVAAAHHHDHDNEGNGKMKEVGKARLAKAAASLLAKRKKLKEQQDSIASSGLSPSSSSSRTRNRNDKYRPNKSAYSERSSDYNTNNEINHDDNEIDSTNDNDDYENDDDDTDDEDNGDGSFNNNYYYPLHSDLIDLTKKIDKKISTNEWNRSSGGSTTTTATTTSNAKDMLSSTKITEIRPMAKQRHDANSMSSLLGHNYNMGEWDDHYNSTTFHVAIVFGKTLVQDQVSVEYAHRIRALVKMMELGGDSEHSEEEEGVKEVVDDEEAVPYRPRLICFTNGDDGGSGGGGAGRQQQQLQHSQQAQQRGGGTTGGRMNSIVSVASAGYIYFRHLCAYRNIAIDEAYTKFWIENDNDVVVVDPKGKENYYNKDERTSMERIASVLRRHHVIPWLSGRPFVERLCQHYGVRRTILERSVNVHFTLLSTEYHLCNLNDVHARSPRKSFLQPLVSMRGLVGSNGGGGGTNDNKAWVDNNIANDGGSGYDESGPSNNFGGIENKVDTTWSFQYSTYPFLHGEEDAVVFLGRCYLLGEELTPLLLNMRGVVEKTEFFQRDNYLLLSSIRRSFVSIVEALYTDKGQEIRAGVINYFEKSRSRGGGRNNRFTREDVQIIVVLESALLNLGRCLDLVKPAGLLVSSVPAATWSKALFNLEESMNRIKAVCDPDRALDAKDWGKLYD